jgi:hypothetical protein
MSYCRVMRTVFDPSTIIIALKKCNLYGQNNHLPDLVCPATPAISSRFSSSNITVVCPRCTTVSAYTVLHLVNNQQLGNNRTLCPRSRVAVPILALRHYRAGKETPYAAAQHSAYAAHDAPAFRRTSLAPAVYRDAANAYKTPCKGKAASAAKQATCSALPCALPRWQPKRMRLLPPRRSGP